ncbi:MAG TPA: DUF418 domain-containing protein [Gammaproteobacteria bacterium]|nr:DUF418 domain-containing protein [Gammaproteobacteria bacterium]|tara:strand:+ start:1556 stop:2890 length:1335 start_codon:yes stop_codon:yes gene_type:complete
MVESTYTTDPASETAATASPVTRKVRIRSIDTLRGVALLGILLMNIIAFGLPYASYFNPVFDSNLEGINLSTYIAMDIFVEGSMRGIFSMLFGAGFLLFITKPDANEGLVRGLYFRRTVLLILIGVFNAYILVWPGDILFTYGVAGLLLYVFRHYSAKKLALVSGIIFAFLAILHTASQMYPRELHGEVLEIEALPASTELNQEQQQTIAEWDTFLDQQFFTPELAEQDLQIRKGGYIETFQFLVLFNLIIQTVGLVASGLWDALAMMLLGMAFMKWGIFNASRSMKFYLGMFVIGFGTGLPINYFEVNAFVSSGFQIYWEAASRPTYDLGRLLVAIGYIGLIMMVCKSGILHLLRSALASVGQMALTNYLSQSLICNAIFMGWGFNLLGELDRFQIYYVVLGVWLFQLIVSPIWLRYFRFGPAEWLWRSLTYKNKQQWRLRAA